MSPAALFIALLTLAGGAQSSGPPRTTIARRLQQEGEANFDTTASANSTGLQLAPLSTKVLGQPLGPGYGFMAALMSGTVPWCGATLVKSNVVLTAGHCLAYSDGSWWKPDTVRIGFPDLRYRTAGTEEIQVRRIVVHPRFRRDPEVTEDGSDLALLVLAAHSKQQPIRLPRKNYVQEGAWAWAAGYSDVGKRYGTAANWFWTQLHTPKVCAAKNRQLAGGSLRASPNTVCTGGQDGRPEGVCLGDSGGPLIVGDAPGPYTQIGVLSWGLGPSPCAPGRIGVNWWVSLSLRNHRKWLARELKKLGHKY